MSDKSVVECLRPITLIIVHFPQGKDRLLQATLSAVETASAFTPRSGIIALFHVVRTLAKLNQH